MNRAVIYTRISDARAALLRLTLTGAPDPKDLERGVDRQMKQCEEVAEKLGVEVIARFKENDLSAYKKNVVRPKFEQILEMIRNGEIDVVIVWHLDRYIRTSRDLNRLIDAADKGVEVASATSGNVDLLTASGRMTARILVAVAEQESEHHAERRVLANKDRADRGEWATSTGARPFGYTQNGIPFEPEAGAFREAVTDVLARKSIRSIVRKWNAAGLTTTRGNKWNATQLRKILVKARYGGLRVYKGEIVGPGNWTPLISEDTYHALVGLLDDPARTNGRTSWEQKHIGSGLYFCGICKTTTMQSCSGGVGNPMAYRCRAIKHLTCNGKFVDDYVLMVIMEWFARENCDQLIDTPVDIGELSTDREGVQKRLVKLTTMFTGGKIDEEQFDAGNEDLREQLTRLDSQLLAATRTSPAAALIDVSRRARAASEDAARAVAKHWTTLSVTQQAQAIDEVAKVTINPVIRRGPGFDPERLVIKPRRGGEDLAAS